MDMFLCKLDVNLQMGICIYINAFLHAYKLLYFANFVMNNLRIVARTSAKFRNSYSSSGRTAVKIFTKITNVLIKMSNIQNAYVQMYVDSIHSTDISKRKSICFICAKYSYPDPDDVDPESNDR